MASAEALVKEKNAPAENPENAAESSVSNNLFLTSINEIENKLVEHSFEAAAELQNAKIKCEENQAVINNMRAEITKYHLGLEKLDETYNVELSRREDIQTIVKSSEEMLNEAATEMETLERQLEMANSMIKALSLHENEPEKVIAADKALNREIDQLMLEARLVLAENEKTKKEEVQLNIAAEEVESLILEKDKLFHDIRKLVAENKALEKELATVDNSGEALADVVKEREEASQQYEELKRKCGELDRERVLAKDETYALQQEIAAYNAKLSECHEATKEVDAAICLKIKSINETTEGITKLQNTIEEIEKKAANQNNILDLKLLEEREILRLQKEEADNLRKQYTELRQIVDDFGIQEKELSDNYLKMTERIKEIEKKKDDVKMKKGKRAALSKLRTTAIEDSRASLRLAQETLTEQLHNINMLKAELNGLNDELKDVQNDNSKLNDTKEELLATQSELVNDKEKISCEIEMLEAEIEELREGDPDRMALVDPMAGENILKNLRSGISVWKEGMRTCVDDLHEQKKELEKDLNNKLISYQEVRAAAEGEHIPEEVLHDLTAREVALNLKLAQQEAEKIRLMAELTGTQGRRAATVNHSVKFEDDSDLSLSASSVLSVKGPAKTKKSKKQLAPQPTLIPEPRQSEPYKRRRLYNPPTVSSTEAFDSEGVEDE